MTSDSSAIAAKAPRHRRIHPAVVLFFIAGLFAVVMLQPGLSLLASLKDAMNSPVTWVVAGLIAILAVVGNRIWAYGKRAVREIETAADALRALQAPDDQQHGLRREKLSDVKRVLPRRHAGHMFASQWAEFEESLVVRDGRYFNTLEARRFFLNDEFESSMQAPVLGLSSSYSFIHEIPGFMTSLGMLGTFVGIAVGLGQLSGVDADNSGVVGEIGGVIQGLASAFWTSIFGLAGASIVTWLNHRSESHISGAMVHFRLELDRCIPRATSEFFLEKQARAAEEQNRALRDLVALQRDAKDSLHSMAQDIAEGTGKMINDRLGPLLEEVTRVVREQISNADARSAETFKGMAEALTGSLVEGIGESVEAIGGYARDISSSFGNLTGELDTRMDEIIRKLGAGLDSSSGRMSAALDQALTGVNERMKGTVRAIEEGITRSSEQLTADVGKMVGEMSSEMDAVGQTMMLSLQRAAQSLVAQTNTMNSALAKALANSGEQISERMDALGSQVAGSMEATTNQLAERVRQIAYEIEQSLGSVTAKLTSELDAVVQPLVQAAHVLRIAGATFENLVQEQKGLLDGYKTASAALSTAATDIGPSVKALRDAHEKHAAMTKRLADAAEEFQEARETLADIERALPEHFNAAAAGLTGASTRLKQLTDGMESWSDSTTTSLERFAGTLAEAVSRTLRDYDASLTHGLSGLNTAANQIAEIAEELGDRAARLTS